MNTRYTGRRQFNSGKKLVKPIPEDEIIDELKRVDRETSGNVSLSDFKELANISFRPLRTAFGGWNEAKEAANIDTKPQGSEQEFSDEEIISELQRVSENQEGAITQEQFDEASKFSHSLVQLRFGSFNKGKKESRSKRESHARWNILVKEKEAPTTDTRTYRMSKVWGKLPSKGDGLPPQGAHKQDL